MPDDTYRPNLRHPVPIGGGTPNSNFFSGYNYTGEKFSGLGSIPGPIGPGDDTYHPLPKEPPGPAWAGGCVDCSGWTGDPFVGDTFSAKFSLGISGNNRLQMPNDSLLPGPFMPGSVSFTIGGHFWFSALSGTGYSDLIARWTGGGHEQFLLGYENVSSQFYFTVKDAADNPGPILYAANTSVVVGTWNHVMASYDKLIGKLRIWVNGVQASVNYASGTHANVSEGVILGARGAAGTSFSGKMETVIIHRGTVWNDAQVNVLRNGGIGVRARRFLHYGLPIPTVVYEFEESANVGKNYWGDSAYDLVNSDDPGHTSGLVTLDLGLPLS